MFSLKNCNYPFKKWGGLLNKKKIVELEVKVYIDNGAGRRIGIGGWGRMKGEFYILSLYTFALKCTHYKNKHT